MSKIYYASDVYCPFYNGEKTNTCCIRCGKTDDAGRNIWNAFGNAGLCRAWRDNKCKADYKTCDIYETLKKRNGEKDI